jgi:hypothetical protein
VSVVHPDVKLNDVSPLADRHAAAICFGRLLVKKTALERFP